MSVIKFENWDGVTPNVLPTGWVGAYHTSAGGGSPPIYNSSPNFAVIHLINSPEMIYWDTDDGNNGDAMASTWVKISGIAGTLKTYVLCRLTGTNSSDIALCTGYVTTLDLSGNALRLSKITGGSISDLSSVSVTLSSTPEHYFIYCRCVGKTISGRVKRVSDSKWLDSSGSWQTTLREFARVQDASVTGAGKSGIAGYSTSNLITTPHFDDFLFETAQNRSLPQVVFI